MLQMVDIDWTVRAALGDASDALAAGNRRAPAIQVCVVAYNARCGGSTIRRSNQGYIQDE